MSHATASLHQHSESTEALEHTVPTRVARYADLRPYKDSFQSSNGVPPEAMRLMSPDKVMPIMAPAGWEGRSKLAPVRGAPGLTITLAECPPGDRAGLHKHSAAVENFFCLEGEFEILWGEQGQHSTKLFPLDFVSVPAGIYRDFRNSGTTMGRLLVMIQPAQGDLQDTVYHAASTGVEIEKRLGSEVRKAMAQIGIQFGEPAIPTESTT